VQLDVGDRLGHDLLLEFERPRDASVKEACPPAPDSVVSGEIDGLRSVVLI
jgi:hypothetical protein